MESSFRRFSLLLIFSVFGLFGVLNLYGDQNTVNTFFTSLLNRNSPGISRQQKVDMMAGSRWIVLTSVYYPTVDIKNLADQPGWNVVVVADTDTPGDWNYTGVHFLSLENQQELFGNFAGRLPYKSYARKNLGYLYAIMNGAEWIYDTDDNIQQYGLGLEQFDFAVNISGLRYTAKSGNVSQKLFNPYRFAGYEHMWPRGFPLEYLEGHTNTKNSMILCKEMRSPAVQQGLVNGASSAIYRILHSKNPVNIDNIAPPVALGAGTYSPWNSRNTLFHYRAFFILYLPTTVTSRATDVWRSYFGQKLLHLIGENVAFYPTNAAQQKHSSLSNLEQEVNVYEHSGKMVEYLDNWRCSSNDIAECALELADGFVENKFFCQEEKALIKQWIEELTAIGYNFPKLTNGTSGLDMGIRYGNCRATNLDLGVLEAKSNEKKFNWASKTIDGFGEILQFCQKANGSSNTQLPSPSEFLKNYEKLEGLKKKQNTALVFLANRPWKPQMLGLLQRMYSPFFKTTIFCGTWAGPSRSTQELPSMEPLNFVNVAENEMVFGHEYGYCMSKIRDLRLNVTGYYFVADDTVFNIWYDLPLEKVLNPEPIVPDPFWWKPWDTRRSFNYFEMKYQDHPKYSKSWQEYNQTLQNAYPEIKNGSRTMRDHYLKAVRRLLSDFMYIPSNKMEYLGNLIEVMIEAEVFVEIAIGKAMDGLEYERGGGVFKYLWQDRSQQFSLYDSSLIGVHPMKLGWAHSKLDYRQQYCNTVIKTFGKEIYGKTN